MSVGGSSESNVTILDGPKVHCIASVTQLAIGSIWVNQPGEDCNWAHIRLIEEIIGAEASLDAINTVTIDKIIKALAVRGKSDATINRYLSHFRTFLKWAHSRNLTTTRLEDLTVAWREESVGRIRWLSDIEEAKVLALVPENVGDLVYVAIRTGCRREELLGATLDNVRGNLLHVWKTKANKSRTIPISDETRDKLVKLLTSGTMPTKAILRTRWQKARVAMGLGDDRQFVFHACRHTCATRLVYAGVDICVIQEWMGHKVIQTTLRYARVKPQALEAALLRAGDMYLVEAEKARVSAENAVPHPVENVG